MNVVFFQTADSVRYRDMLLATSRTVSRYVQPRGYAQEVFLGVKRGRWPWQASFNRIYIFEELIARGWADWAVYMDADAFVADLNFDLGAYLSDKADRCAVMTPSNATKLWWDVNSGVLMVNLRHPFGRRLVEQWRAAFEQRLPDEALQRLEDWSNPNDQELLQEIISGDPQIAAAIHFEPPTLFNSLDARFVRQITREAIPDFDERLRIIAERVEEVLAPIEQVEQDAPAHKARAKCVAIVTQAYEGVLRRAPDEAGLRYFEALVEQLGPEVGWRRMVMQMMQSDEYRARLARDAEAPAA